MYQDPIYALAHPPARLLGAHALAGFVSSEREDHFSRVTELCVDAARSTIDDLAESIKTNFLCCDEGVTTSSLVSPAARSRARTHHP